MINVLDEIVNTTLCGGIAIPNTLFNLVSNIIKLIKIVVPILLIIWGMLDFAKSIVAKKEDEIKEYRKAFIGRLVSAILVFLMIVIVQFIVKFVDGVETQSNVKGQTTGDVWACSKKFIEGVNTEDTVDTDNTENK